MSSSLYTVAVVRNIAIAELPASRLLDAQIIELAKRSKWPKYATFAKDPRGLLATIVTALRALPAAQAGRTLAPSSQLLPVRRALKQLALHTAGHASVPDGSLVELTVTAIHPDAGMPAEATAYGKLDTFIVRLLASASTANAYSAYAAATKPIRVSKDVLWAYSLGRATKAKPPAFLVATLELAGPTEQLSHLEAGRTFESTAYMDPPKRS